jgi:two-component system, OmpR family, phosphate regulon response regulator PhoB
MLGSGGLDMPKKILVVDDEKDIRDLVEATLLRSDHVVIKAESGDKAVEIARTEKPHLILMDIMMPGNLDGLQATRVLKNDPETQSCRIVLLTAKGQVSDRRAGIEAGADDYFVKPFSPLELLRKVDQILGG